MEKIKHPKENIGGSGSFFDEVNDATLVTVASGPYYERLPIAGQTIAQIRESFSARFDIDPKSTAVINGKDADESMMLVAGVTLMFMNRAGEKGADRDVTALVQSPKLPLYRVTKNSTPHPCLFIVSKTPAEAAEVAIETWERRGAPLPKPPAPYSMTIECMGTVDYITEVGTPWRET